MKKIITAAAGVAMLVAAPVEKPQGTQGGTQGKLAKTGATPAGLIGTGILVAGGVALAVARYKRR